MLGKTLAQYCPNDSAMAKEQRRIEKELADFEQNLWGKPEPKDSLDSIARVDKKAARALMKKNRRAGGTTVQSRKASTAKVSKSRHQGNATSAPSGAARVTVRRQRH